MKNVIYLFLFSFLFSCTKKERHTFSVEGKVRNSNAKMIYLEEDIAGSLQPVVVDSAILNKDGAFKLGGAFKEQSMFSLRTDNEKYPAALLINDTRKVEVTVDATDKNVPYEIKGSPASQAIIEFDKNIDREAQIISQLRQEADSLMKSKAND